MNRRYRKTIIAGNWKMNNTLSQMKAFAEQIKPIIPKGKWCKAHPGTRPIKDFALPMILCNLSLEIEQLIDKQLIDQTIETCLHEVMEVFYQKDLGLIVENVSAEDNSLVDSFEGRSVNPGHSLEAMWFIMDLGKRLGRPELIDKAVKIALSTIEYGWDKQYGGIFSRRWAVAS